MKKGAKQTAAHRAAISQGKRAKRVQQELAEDLKAMVLIGRGLRTLSKEGRTWLIRKLLSEVS